MSVISSEIIEDSVQADGRRFVGFEFTFHTAEKIIRRFMVEAAYDKNAGLSAMIPSIEVYKIEEEDAELIGQIEQSTLLALDVIPIHPETETESNRKRRIRRKILRKIMKERDIKLARSVLYPIWYWLKYESGYTAQQIANYLDISLAVLQKVNSRFQAIHDNLAMLDDDDSYVGEVE